MGCVSRSLGLRGWVLKLNALSCLAQWLARLFPLASVMNNSSTPAFSSSPPMRALGPLSPPMRALGPWSECLQNDLGPWSSRSTPGDQDEKAARKKARRPVEGPPSDFGPWQRSQLGLTTAKESASKVVKSRSHGVAEHKPQASSAQGPWDQVNKSKVKGKQVDLTAACVIDIPQAVRAHQAPNTKTTEKAKDPKAIKERYLGKGRCVCAEHKDRGGQPCHRAVPLSTLIRLCIALAGMSQEEKGFIFHHMYSEAKDQGASKRLRWHIEDHKLCFTNFCHMLFVSTSTVREYVTIEPGPDGQRISKRHTTLSKQRTMGQPGQEVDFFFQEYYQSAGEPLPQITQRAMCQGVKAMKDGDNVDADILQSVNGRWGPWLNHGDRLNGVDNDEYDPDRPITDTAHMCTLACDGAVVGLPVRFLQHSSLWALYWQFLAHWEALHTSGRVDRPTGARGAKRQRQGEKLGEAAGQGVKVNPPSFSTFQRRWQAVWQHYLKFRKSSSHAQCNTCFKMLQVMFERGSSVEERIDAARRLSGNVFHAK